MNNIRHTLRLMLAMVMTCGVLPALSQTKVEYFIDNDPGHGKATLVNKAIGEDGALDFDVSTLNLPDGTHTIGYRSFSTDKDGQAAFSPTILHEFHVSAHHELRCIEYFWDDDPGYNNGTQISLPTDAGTDYLTELSIPTDGQTPGAHRLGIRTFGSLGWSPTIISEVYVKPDASANRIVCLEYFWDNDPGHGLGTIIAFPADSGTDYQTQLNIPTDGVSPGMHTLGFRSYGSLGWTPTMLSEVNVPRTGEAAMIGYAEYFWNEDPGYGQGTPLAFAKGSDVTIENMNLPTHMVGGNCLLFVRTHGQSGWSPTMAFPVTVNCEGNYTLNNTLTTDQTQRTYQSMDDAFSDFHSRGICNGITLNVTTSGVTYPLDLTGEEMQERLTALADNMEQISTARQTKTICFRADAGKTGNVIDVTVDPAQLKEAIRLFAHSEVENVTLRINDTVYDFSALAQRSEETCGETAEYDLTHISEGLQAVWTAQPHNGNKITGYEANGTGNLPEMVLTNTGTVLDSLTYAITINDAQGETLYTYNYNMYVHVLVSTKGFSGMTPAAGSSLDPVATTLKWNAIAGATKGYRLHITEQTGTEEPEQTDITTTGTSYVLDVKSGYHYTWTVTALGECDQLLSTEMSLDGRLLPDLQVAEITTPEYVEGGNQLSVTAHIVNKGAGATTEKSWTDRLFYSLGSDDFAQAVKVTDINHSGNIAPDGSYDVTFTINAPEATNGTLYYYVVTDVNSKVMETLDDNNSQRSDEMMINPFFVNETDFAALGKLYEDYNGSNWNGAKWDTGSRIIRSSNWSGVTFDTEGYVIALNLQQRGLQATLTAENGLTFPRLATLNVSRNALKGDIAQLVKGCEALVSLNAAYNQIDALSTPLQSLITSIDLSYQHRSTASTTVWPGLADVTVTAVPLGQSMTENPCQVLTYNHAAQDYSTHVVYAVFDKSYKRLGTLNWNQVKEAYSFTASSWYVSAEQDKEVILEPTSGILHNSAYPATLHYTVGDANINGLVDVNDVQRTLNYVINSNNTSTFHYQAANTFEDETINIQDLVSTVNIVLSEEAASQPAMAKRMLRVNRADTDAAMAYIENGYICLSTEQEIAALELTVRGISSSMLRLMLDGSLWQMQTRNTRDGVRLMVFSPAGATLTAGDIRMLRFSGKAELTAADASSPEATSVTVGISDSNATGISDIDAETDESPAYDLSGRRILKSQRGVTITKGKKLIK